MDSPGPTSPQPAPSPPGEAVNVAALLDRCMGRADLAATLLGKLERQAAGDISALESLVAATDLSAAASRAHALKGAAAALAAGALQECASKLERACRDQAVETAASAVKALRTEVDRFLSDLPRVRDRFAAPSGPQGVRA